MSPSSAEQSHDKRAAEAFFGRLRAIAGSDRVITGRASLAEYESDWTGRFHGRAGVAVCPATTAEVAAILDTCRQLRWPLVVRGGGTGLVGGSVPLDEELILDLRRLNAIEAVDTVAGQVTVDAGATLEAVQRHAATEGLDLPIDLAARSGATIGGMVATDAAGALAARYGAMRAHIVGLEAVLADGRVVSRLGGLVKDTAGYNLPQMLIGTEGTLAVITRVRLRLTRRPQRRVAALFGVPDISHGVDLAVALRRELKSALEAVDVFDAAAMEIACAHLRATRPVEPHAPFYVIVDVATDEQDPVDALSDALPGFARDLPVAIAEGTSRRVDLWRFREILNEAVGALGEGHKLDVSVPIGVMSAFTKALVRLSATEFPSAHLVLWGHLGDGNLHVNLIGLDPASERFDESVLRLVASHNGSISAEHGVGLAKRKWLGLTRTPDELAAMRTIKEAFDPQGILAPGRVFPALDSGVGEPA